MNSDCAVSERTHRPRQVTNAEATKYPHASHWDLIGPGGRSNGSYGSGPNPSHTAYINPAAFQSPAPYTFGNTWIVFRSNMFGATQVFEVEVAKANDQGGSASTAK